MVFALGLVAAALLAVGFVVQHHSAEQEPLSRSLSPRLLIDLAQRPMWLAGIAAMVGGQMLGGVALGRGNVALVEPLLASNLLFALPLTALWHRRSLRGSDWLGAVVLIGGLAGFVVAGRPHGGTPEQVTDLGWTKALTLVVAVALLATLAGRRRQVSGKAALFAVGAGLLFGLQDTLTRSAVTLLERGVLTALVSWQPYMVVTVAVAGLLLAQSAFDTAPLAASLPALTAAEPLTGIMLGLALFGEHLTTVPLAVTGEVAGLLAMCAGVLILGRSPIVTGELHRLPDADSRAA